MALRNFDTLLSRNFTGLLDGPVAISAKHHGPLGAAWCGVAEDEGLLARLIYADAEALDVVVPTYVPSTSMLKAVDIAFSDAHEKSFE